MNLKPFTGSGSTPSRRRFWDKVTQAVIASQKVAGRFVTVDEHPGKGTVINVNDTSSRRPTPPPTTGACCDDEGNCTITTEAGCEGTFQGVGTVCDPNPCVTCTSCGTGSLFNALCMDEDGNCFTGPEGCVGFECGGEMVPCDSWWLVYNQYCIDCPGGDTFLCARSIVDPITCEQTDECITEDCCDECVSGSVAMMSEQAVFCMGACCIEGVCSITSSQDCTESGGFWQGADTVCDPDPC